MNEHAGKTCLLCRQALKEGESIVVCPSCNTPQHEACWIKNNCCVRFGCFETSYGAQGTPRGPVAAYEAPQKTDNQEPVPVVAASLFEEDPVASAKAQEENTYEKYCTTCGAGLERNQAFCTTCGTPTEAVSQEEPIEATPEEPSAEEKTPQEIEPLVKEPYSPEAAEAAEATGAEQRCAVCGAVMTQDQVFCTSCGAPKNIGTKTCTHCGAQLQSGTEVCTACGEKLTDENKDDINPAIAQFNSGIDTAKEKKKPIKLLVIIGAVIALVLAAVLVLPKIFVSIDGLCARGEYAKAYEKADSEKEKLFVRAENVAVVMSAFTVENMKSPDSFELEEAYYREAKNEDGNTIRHLVLYVSGENGDGKTVTNYWVFVWSLEDEEWELFDNYVDLKTVNYNKYDDEDEKIEKLLHNLGVDAAKKAKEDGIRLTDAAINRINKFKNRGTLDDIVLLNVFK